MNLQCTHSMFGISYGELFLLIGATAALVGNTHKLSLSLSLMGYVILVFNKVLLILHETLTGKMIWV